MDVIPQHSTNPYRFVEKINFMPAKKWSVSTSRLTTDITEKIWSACIWKGGERQSKNFVRADWLVLDYDSGEPVEQAINRFSDTIHLIGTTQSHRPDHHKFRVCLLFEKPITDLETFIFNMAHYIDRFEADSQCKDAARGFFPCREVVSKNADPDCYRVDVLKPPDRWRSNVDQQAIEPIGHLPTWMKPHLFGRPVEKGVRDKCLFRMLKDLRRLQMDKEDAVTFINNRIRFEENHPGEFGVLQVAKKADYVWEKYHVEEK